MLKIVVGEGKRRRITAVVSWGLRTATGRGREGGFGDERLWKFWGGGWSRTKLNLFQTLRLRSELWFGVWELEGLWRLSHLGSRYED